MRFLLPRPPRTVALLGEARDCADAFERVGVEVVAGEDPADLVLAPAAALAAAAERARGAVVLDGRAPAGALRRHGLTARDLLPLPDARRPSLVLPLDQPAAMRGALRHLGSAHSPLKALRNRLAPPLLGRGLVPPGRDRLTVGLREPGPPFLVRAAHEAGVRGGSQLFWTTGASDVLSRGALFLFDAGGVEPSSVVKFGRVRGHADAFERDARGHEVVARAGGLAAAHAPQLLARLEVDGLHAAVESAATGERLVNYLASVARPAAKLAAIDRIAGWIVGMGRETTAAPPAIGRELSRLRGEILPAWSGDGAGDGLLSGLDRVPAVLQHNDLGTWNLLVDGPGFTAVDWESARDAGLPLWDLLYFLAYAIVALERVPAERQEAHLVGAFLGRAKTSALLFRWVRAAVSALALQPEAVGRLATTCWLHHGRSHVARDTAVREAGGEPAEALNLLPRRLARRWLLEPGLGAGWSAWRA